MCFVQDGDAEPANFAKKRLHLSLSLYYKLLDAIMKDEEKKKQDLASLQVSYMSMVKYAFHVHSSGLGKY